MNLKKIDKKLYPMIFTFGGVFILIILFIIIGKMIVGNRVTYDQIEIKMKNASISYFQTKEDNLPKQDGEKVTVSIQTLVEAKKIKELSKITKNKSDVCDGYVTVANNNGYYLYTPYLDCGKSYKTTTLVSELKDPSKVVVTGNGLYQMGDTYVYRGEFVDNYVSFANQLWRILRIDEKGNMRVIQVNGTKGYVWDDRYNKEVEKKYGINTYSISRIHDSIVNVYNDNNIFTKEDKSHIVSHDMCIGKRSEAETINDGSIECSERMENQPLGMFQANEYFLGSIDPNCQGMNTASCVNYNYITTLGNSFWSITTNSENTTEVYAIGYYVYTENAYKKDYLNLVLHLSGDHIYKGGTGTETDPYIIG